MSTFCHFRTRRGPSAKMTKCADLELKTLFRASLCKTASRSARIVIFALGTPLIDSFQQSAPVCAKQHFQPEISTFCPFRSGRTTFKAFLAKCTSLYKTALSAKGQHVLSFLHWAHHFLAFSAKCTSFWKSEY